METVNLSLSKINTFISCPLKYKLAYVDEVQAEKSEGAGLSFYKSLYGTLEFFHKKGLNPIPDWEAMRELLGRNWSGAGYRDELEEKQHRELAEKILKNFHDQFLREKPHVSYVNLRAAARLGQFQISTRIDRIDLLPDGTYEVINYKTGKSALEPEELADDLQTAVLYLAANAHKRFEGKVSKVGFYFLRAGRKVSISPSPGDLAKIVRRIQDTAGSIVKFSRPPGLVGKLLKRERDPAELGKRGALCASCEYLAVCPAWPLKPRTLSGDSPEEFARRLRLSYSKLNSYQRCPRAWKKVYLDGFGTKPRPFFSFGTAIHETLENFHHPAHKDKPSLKQLLALWEEAFAGHQEGYGGDRTQAAQYHAQGVKMLQKYYARYADGDKFRRAFRIEEYFEVPVGKNALVTGFIDRIDRLPDGTCEIIDYKTEPTLRTQQAVDEDDQLTIYFMACAELLKLDVSKLSLLMLAHDTEISTTRRREDIPAVKAAIDSSAAEIKEKTRLYQEAGVSEESPHFPPRKNKYCKSCDYLETCALQNEIRGDSSTGPAAFDENASTEEYD